MKDLKTDMSVMNVGDAVKRLAFAYDKIIKSGAPLKIMPSVMLWGAPGVGKSQLVRQIADSLENSTGKKVVVTDVRLLLFNPVDLRGIPTFDATRTLSVWLRPKIFDMDASSDVINVLFLDEITAAPQSVQAAAYQITLDRVVGEHKLPDNCIVIAAGNRVTDRSVAYKMPRALANRLLHIEIEVNFSSWAEWAIKNKVNKKVLGFLTFRRSFLCEEPDGSDRLAFATPRSWELVSNVLNNVSDDMSLAYPLVAGLIGVGAATEFRVWSKIYSELPSVEKIFAGANVPVPRESDRLYALVSSMIEYAREKKEDLRAVENSVRYALDFPPDYAVVLLLGYQSIEKDYVQKLLTMPSYRKWFETRGRYLNGIA